MDETSEICPVHTYLGTVWKIVKKNVARGGQALFSFRAFIILVFLTAHPGREERLSELIC